MYVYHWFKNRRAVRMPKAQAAGQYWYFKSILLFLLSGILAESMFVECWIGILQVQPHFRHGQQFYFRSALLLRK